MGIICLRTPDPLSATIPRNSDILLADVTPIIESQLPIICLIGGPGSGKTSLCRQITKQYDLCAIIIGDLLRDEIDNTQRGIILAYLMFEEKLIPSDVVVELMKMKILNTLHNGRGFLISGFPRGKEQCKHLDKYIRPPDAILYLWVRSSVLLDRVLAKTVTATERQSHNIDELKERIKEYNKLAKQVVKYYKKKIIVINGENETPEVYDDTCKAIDIILKNFPSTSVAKSDE